VVCDQGYKASGPDVQWTCDSDKLWQPDGQVTPKCVEDPEYCAVKLSSGCKVDDPDHPWTVIHTMGAHDLADYETLAGNLSAVLVVGDRCTAQLVHADGSRGRVLHKGMHDCVESAAYRWARTAHKIKVWKNSPGRCGMVSGALVKRWQLAPCHAPF